MAGGLIPSSLSQKSLSITPTAASSKSASSHLQAPCLSARVPSSFSFHPHASALTSVSHPPHPSLILSPAAEEAPGEESNAVPGGEGEKKQEGNINIVIDRNRSNGSDHGSDHAELDGGGLVPFTPREFELHLAEVRRESQRAAKGNALREKESGQQRSLVVMIFLAPMLFELNNEGNEGNWKEGCLMFRQYLRCLTFPGLSCAFVVFQFLQYELGSSFVSDLSVSLACLHQKLRIERANNRGKAIKRKAR